MFLDEHAARFAEALPSARWTRIEGAGHSIQGDAPGALVREIWRFLEALRGVGTCIAASVRSMGQPPALRARGNRRTMAGRPVPHRRARAAQSEETP